MNQKSNNYFRKEKAFLFAFWLVTVAKTASTMTINDPDLWGHLLYGMEHLSTGFLIMMDPYSYTAHGAPWINHEWLSELLFAFSWKSFGSVGLWAVRILLIGTTLGLVLKLISENTKGIWSGFLIYVFCWYEMARAFAIRPQLFTFFFFSVFLFWIYRIYLKRRWSPLLVFAFIPLMGLWANLHGGFVIGIGLLFWLTVYSLLEYWQGRMTRLMFNLNMIAVIMAFAATLINPYGIDLWEWLYRSLLTSRGAKITEWAPVYSYHPQWSVIPLYVTMILMALLLIATRLKRNLFEWGLLVTLCLAAFINNRHGVFFSLTAAVMLPRHLESIFPRLTVPRGFHPSFIKAVIIFCSLYAVVIHLLPGHKPTTILVRTSEHPYNAIKFIHDNNLMGNLVVYFDWAQSTLWYLHDTCKVAFDGRFRTVYPKEIEDDYFHFHNLDDQWTNIIDRYKTQMILMPKNWPGVKTLEKFNEWQIVYQSVAVDEPNKLHQQPENAVLLIRSNMFPDFESRLMKKDIISPGNRTIFRFGEALNNN